MQGGQYVFQLLESYGASTTLLLVVVLEAISITWFYGLQNFTSDIRTMIGRTPSVYWQLCWSILSPAMLLVSSLSVDLCHIKIVPISLELVSRKSLWPNCLFMFTSLL